MVPSGSTKQMERTEERRTTLKEAVGCEEIVLPVSGWGGRFVHDERLQPLADQVILLVLPILSMYLQYISLMNTRKSRKSLDDFVDGIPSPLFP